MKKYLLLFLFVYFSSLKASPVSFDFSQNGFEEGASVTGRFTGEDLDGNGKLESKFGEVTTFSMFFSGNSLVSSFSIGLADSADFFLSYDLGGSYLGEDSEGIFIESSDGYYYAKFIPRSSGSSVSDPDGGVSSSPQIVQLFPGPISESAKSAVDDITKRASQDTRFNSPIIGSYRESLGWNVTNWELRWLDFHFSENRVVRLYHVTDKRDPSIKYTLFEDPDTGEWTDWVEV